MPVHPWLVRLWRRYLEGSLHGGHWTRMLILMLAILFLIRTLLALRLTDLMIVIALIILLGLGR